MNDGYRPDGLTANKVRGMLNQERADWRLEKLCMALAREIDYLREYTAGLDQRLTDHKDPDLVGGHYRDDS